MGFGFGLRNFWEGYGTMGSKIAGSNLVHDLEILTWAVSSGSELKVTEFHVTEHNSDDQQQRLN